MIEEIRLSLSRHLRGYDVRSVSRLGAGSDNVAYEVNGELIVRRTNEPDLMRRSELTRREADVLAAVTRWSTLLVPELVYADPEAGVLVYRKVPGLPLLEHPVLDPAALAPTLGEFLSRLHSAPVETMEELVPRDSEPLTTWRREAKSHYLDVVDHVPPADGALVEDFLGHAPPPESGSLAFCHGDLGAEHILVDVQANAVTGIIDWTDAAIADPARDLALIYRDLGPVTFDLTLDHYTGRFDDADRDRAFFYARCTLLEDIEYGLRTGARPYAEAGLGHLARTFE